MKSNAAKENGSNGFNMALSLGGNKLICNLAERNNLHGYGFEENEVLVKGNIARNNGGNGFFLRNDIDQINVLEMVDNASLDNVGNGYYMLGFNVFFRGFHIAEGNGLSGYAIDEGTGSFSSDFSLAIATSNDAYGIMRRVHSTIVLLPNSVEAFDNKEGDYELHYGGTIDDCNPCQPS